MAPKVKAFLGVMSEAVETMVGGAFCVVALYALLFSNFTGNGTLWDSLRGVVREMLVPGAPAVASTVQMRVVPVRPPDMVAKAQNHMLLVPEAEDQAIVVPVVAQVQPRAPEQITDAPADKAAGKDWRVHLTSQLRSFTVYGQGEQRGSAASAAGSAAPARAAGAAGAAGAAPAAVASAPTPAAPNSAYRLGATAAGARPGISDHVSSEDGGTADGVRNFR